MSAFSEVLPQCRPENIVFISSKPDRVSEKQEDDLPNSSLQVFWCDSTQEAGQGLLTEPRDVLNMPFGNFLPLARIALLSDEG